jgi:hypothetical protein
MKRSTFASNSKEKGKEWKKVRSNDENLFKIIPIEVTDSIISLCGIVERHVLRFISREFHRLTHKIGTTQNEYFWFVKSSNESISFYAAVEDYLSVLEWMKMCFLSDQFPLYEGLCEGAARGGHLKILKRYAQR